ncbi:MAG: glycosyltransferase [Deltaproteobacteria bacterium]|nr:glycosyltransferase [Deltaproteobacteria bacterium]
MVSVLSDDFDFRIVTADRDFKDKGSYPDVVVDDWNQVGRAKVLYCSPDKRSLLFWVRLLRGIPYDVLYLNSFFDPFFTQMPLLARLLGIIPRRPTILAPRGALARGALALKAWKKKPYLGVVNTVNLYKDITWQASSQYEAADIRRAMGEIAKRIVLAIVLAPDMPGDRVSISGIPNGGQSPQGGALRVCFLSRICEMKNLDYALRVLAQVKAPVIFNIYGVAEDILYWQHCQRLIKDLPAHVVVHYHGRISHDKVLQTLSMNELFFLPTRGENYGHVIFEALAAGLPVLISDKTPWRNLESLGVGWDLPLEAQERFCAVIEAQAALDNEARAEYRRRAREYAELTAADDQVLQDNLALFWGAITGKQIIQPYLKE